MTDGIASVTIAPEGTIVGRDSRKRPDRAAVGIETRHVSKDEVLLTIRQGVCYIKHTGLGAVRVVRAGRDAVPLYGYMKVSQTLSMHVGDILQFLRYMRTCSCPRSAPCVCTICAEAPVRARRRGTPNTVPH